MRKRFRLDTIDFVSKSLDSAEGEKRAIFESQRVRLPQNKTFQTTGAQNHTMRSGYAPTKNLDGSESITIEIMDQSQFRR